MPYVLARCLPPHRDPRYALYSARTRSGALARAATLEISGAQHLSRNGFEAEDSASLVVEFADDVGLLGVANEVRRDRNLRVANRSRGGFPVTWAFRI